MKAFRIILTGLALATISSVGFAGSRPLPPLVHIARPNPHPAPPFITPNNPNHPNRPIDMGKVHLPSPTVTPVPVKR